MLSYKTRPLRTAEEILQFARFAKIIGEKLPDFGVNGALWGWHVGRRDNHHCAPINPIFLKKVSKSVSASATRKRSASENRRPSAYAFSGF